MGVDYLQGYYFAPIKKRSVNRLEKTHRHNFLLNVYVTFDW